MGIGAVLLISSGRLVNQLIQFGIVVVLGVRLVAKMSVQAAPQTNLIVGNV
jgi:formate dehydrogenase assembly factor FdhD